MMHNLQAVDVSSSVSPPCDIALVSMPFASALGPSIQIGLLKAIVGEQGFLAATYHLNLDLVKRIGLPLYMRISQVRGLLGEWLFSIEAFGDQAPDCDGLFLEEFREDLNQKLTGLDCSMADLRYIRDCVIPSYLDTLLGSVRWDRYAVVGFTSTFQQTVPSIALARRIKLAYPHVKTVFGGANFEAGMGLELVRSVPWIDYVVIGEGDTALPALLRAVREGSPDDVPGVATRVGDTVRHTPQDAPYRAMDALPTPDYSEYFERVDALSVLAAAERRMVTLPFEAARGCWWGVKHHCTFCGLNGQTMQFRSKSPERVARELAELARRHGSFHFDAVDNIIDHRYFKTLLPLLVELNADYSLFYEVKSNLTRDQIRLLSRAGVRRIQPGLESLSTHVLDLMNKGVTALQNVNTLRWSLYYGLEVDWNLIWGFPGETAGDYHRHEELIPRILHLQPPSGRGRFWMERFSPAFADRAAFPVRSMRPESAYSHVYPLDIDINEIAYFFEYELKGALPDSTYEGTAQRVDEWKELWSRPERPTLTYRFAPGLLRLEDARCVFEPRIYSFHDLHAALYVACSDRPLTLVALLGDGRWGVDRGAIKGALDEYCDLGLMIRDGDQFLSIGLPATTNR